MAVSAWATGHAETGHPTVAFEPVSQQCWSLDLVVVLVHFWIWINRRDLSKMNLASSFIYNCLYCVFVTQPNRMWLLFQTYTQWQGHLSDGEEIIVAKSTVDFQPGAEVRACMCLLLFPVDSNVGSVHHQLGLACILTVCFRST